jgi:3'-phosphoadenosine 5'-phosphosulfate sulfotransferase (PAPS reductase)/FAD synthetase
MSSPVVAWWSGGVTSAVTCHICIELFGLDNVRFVFMDTGNEDDDAYRFKADCEMWYGKDIETITFIGVKYDKIQSVWRKYKSLNVAHGAICSSELKRELRIEYQRKNSFTYQAFGFDIDESKRAKSMSLNYKDASPIFPLLLHGLSKKSCIKILNDNGIRLPRVYGYGFHNNNCFNTGCVQGGIGYWQKMKAEFPDKFNAMADMEHELTDAKGEPVTMLKDQSKKAKASGNQLVFLKKHPKYPHLKCIDQMRGFKLEPLFECNGFCGINDMDDRKATEGEINFSGTLFENI